MNKKWMILIGVVLVVIIGVVLYFALRPAPEVPVSPVSSGEEEVGLAEQAEVATITQSDRTDIRWVDIKYPNLQSFRNKDFQQSINSEITRVINVYRDELSVVVDEQTPKEAHYYYKTSYEKYCHGDYLSLVILNDYQTGGIRSNKWKDIYNIDVRRERKLTLGDIFPATVDYEKEIISEITQQAKDENIILMNGEDIKELNTKQKFFLKNEKLVIYFDPGEIASAKYGALEFVMPFTLGEDGRFRP